MWTLPQVVLQHGRMFSIANHASRLIGGPGVYPWCSSTITTTKPITNGRVSPLPSLRNPRLRHRHGNTHGLTFTNIDILGRTSLTPTIRDHGSGASGDKNMAHANVRFNILVEEFHPRNASSEVMFNPSYIRAGGAIDGVSLHKDESANRVGK